MTVLPPPSRPGDRARAATALLKPWAARGDRRALRGAPLARRYELAWLTAGGIATGSRVAPAAAPFEQAFAALARGTLIATAAGPVAVEDLRPGAMVVTAGGTVEPLLWIGSMTFFPQARPDTDPARLVRITADSFGLGRPMPDLLLGPQARILMTGARLRARTGLDAAFVPARALADGLGVVEIAPAAPVTVYHLMLRGQAGLMAGGLAVESCDPGPGLAELADPQARALYLALFPHLDGAAGFGPAPVPRLTPQEAEVLASG